MSASISASSGSSGSSGSSISSSNGAPFSSSLKVQRKLFLLEDDTTLGELLSERLTMAGYHVAWKSSVSEGLAYIKEHSDIDLALLDVGLGDGTGFEFAKEMQKINFQIPFLFLTAQADAESRLLGFELGAKEYIPKPFHLKEVLLRLENIFKVFAPSDVYTLEHCEVRVSELVVCQNDKNQKTQLTPSEMKLLDLLIKKSPKVIHRDEIMNEVWGENKELNQRTIDNMVLKIRHALGEDGQKIRTIRGVGYQFQN